MEAHDQILHGLLDMGQMLLLCGAEINRVEDTMTRLGRAYGAKKVDIFAITSDIVLTILFEDGVELTQTRRINKASSFDFVKLERLNALSRRYLPLHEADHRADKGGKDAVSPGAAEKERKAQRRHNASQIQRLHLRLLPVDFFQLRAKFRRAHRHEQAHAHAGAVCNIPWFDGRVVHTFLQSRLDNSR